MGFASHSPQAAILSACRMVGRLGFVELLIRAQRRQIERVRLPEKQPRAARRISRRALWASEMKEARFNSFPSVHDPSV
jgi:hypothetical protein